MRSPPDRSVALLSRWRVLFAAFLAVGVVLAGGAVAAQDEFEPNDDRDDATSVSAGTYEGLEIVNGESDFYAIELEEDERINATISFDNSEGDLDLRLYHESVGVAGSWAMAEHEEHVSYVAPEAGTYYVEAYGANGWTNNTYDLEIEVESVETEEDGASDQFEPNDVAEEAAPLEAGAYEDLSVSGTESDYYAVDVQPGEELYASIEFENDEGDLELALYEDVEHAALLISDSSNDEEWVRYPSDDGGTYYLRVYGYDNAANDYSLDLELREPDDESQADSTDGEEDSDGASDDGDDDGGDEDDGSSEEPTDESSSEPASTSDEATSPDEDDGDGGDDGLPGFGMVAALVGFLAAIAVVSRRRED